MSVQNIGLDTWLISHPEWAAVQASGVPPLGEAIAPISGFPGDGAAVTTQVGGWSSGPGAVRWHGGQWVMPYTLTPGSSLSNVSCDIWNPTTSAPANVLVEVVSSNGQVLGSATAPASTSVVFRTWPFVGTHAAIDGEQFVVRLSPRDATTGAWTSAAQDTTVIGCAVRSAAAAVAAATINIPVIPTPAGAGFAANGFAVTSWAVNTSAADDGVVLPVHGVPVGATITSVRAKLSDSTGAPATAVLQAKEMPGLAPPIWTGKGSAASAGTGAIQLIQFSPGYVVPASTEMILVVHGISVSPLRIYSAEIDYQ
jgi:hypothetical protein